MTISALLADLRINPSGHAYTARAVPGWTDVYLGVSISGQPCLFVTADGQSSDPPLRTAKVALRLSQEFNLDVGSGASRHLLHSLSCESSQRVDVETFVTLVEALLARYQGTSIEGADLTAFFRSLVRLFSVPAVRDLAAERQGLWGELFVMRQLRGFGFWAPRWHSEVTRAFDFSAATRRVEVKTTAGAQRVHQFSHRQIRALPGEEIVIASVLLREDDAGVSLQTLIGDARNALLGTPDFLKLETAVRRAGMEDSAISGPAYDLGAARGLLAWFRADEAPQFRMPEPPGVSETRYKVDLSTAPQLAEGELHMWLDQFAIGQAGGPAVAFS